jgi:hypothetical protein
MAVEGESNLFFTASSQSDFSLHQESTKTAKNAERSANFLIIIFN